MFVKEFIRHFIRRPRAYLFFPVADDKVIYGAGLLAPREQVQPDRSVGGVDKVRRVQWGDWDLSSCLHVLECVTRLARSLGINAGGINTGQKKERYA